MTTAAARGRARRYGVKLNGTRAPQLTKDETAKRKRLGEAEQRTRFTRMTPEERTAQFNRDLNACREIRRKWRQRERDAAMIQRQKDAEQAHARRVIAESDQQRRAAVIAGMVMLAQRLSHR